jgi:hypothetical protein
MLIYQGREKFLQLLPCLTSAAMDCVFHVYMQQEDKAIMILHITVVKQHSQHIMTPTRTIYMTVVKQLTVTTKHMAV